VSREPRVISAHRALNRLARDGKAAVHRPALSDARPGRAGRHFKAGQGRAIGRKDAEVLRRG
jgi:hypothetical protein